MNTFIEVKSFGDFDVLYTNCIMFHKDNLDLDKILNEFYEIEGISSNTGLDYRKLYEITEKFISFLELKGFKELKTKSIYFCD